MTGWMTVEEGGWGYTRTLEHSGTYKWSICVFQQRIKKVLAVQSCSQATEQTEGGKDGWKEEGKWRSWPYAFMDWLHKSSPVLPSYNRSVSCFYSSLTSLILPLPSSLCSVPNKVRYPLLPFSSFPSYSPHFLCLTPLFFLRLPFSPSPSYFPCSTSSSSFVSNPCSSSSSSSSTWGTPGSRRRWSISILPLGFPSPIWGRPGLLSPSGSEHHYWLPHASHPGRRQRPKSPASRCASGLPA